MHNYIMNLMYILPYNAKFEAMFMSSGKSKSSDPHRLVLNLADK